MCSLVPDPSPLLLLLAFSPSPFISTLSTIALPPCLVCFPSFIPSPFPQVCFKTLPEHTVACVLSAVLGSLGEMPVLLVFGRMLRVLRPVKVRYLSAGRSRASSETRLAQREDPGEFPFQLALGEISHNMSPGKLNSGSWNRWDSLYLKQQKGREEEMHGLGSRLGEVS